MIRSFRCFVTIFLLIMTFSTPAFADKEGAIVPNIKVGMGIIGTGPVNYAHGFDVGYYHCKDYGVLSYGPAICGSLYRINDKWTPGFKFSYEAILTFVGAKVDLTQFNKFTILGISGGVSFLGYINLFVGYNHCLSDPGMSGISINLFGNINIGPRGSNSLLKVGG